MFKFKNWMKLREAEYKDFDYYKNLVLGKLNLNNNYGLSQDINTWKPESLISILNGLGEFKALSQNIQSQVIGQIRSQMGTIGDIIRIMSQNKI